MINFNTYLVCIGIRLVTLSRLIVRHLWEILVIAIVDVISHGSLAASEFQEIGFGAIAARNFPPEEIYPRNRRDLSFRANESSV